MTQLTLRPPAAADLPALAALSTAAFTATFGELYRPADLIPFLVATHSEGAWARDLANPALHTILAVEGPIPVGWAKLAHTPAFPHHARTPRAMELKQLYTAPNAQGHGIGTALMNAAMAEFTRLDATEIHLSVWQHNHAAQRFYARYGFERHAEVTFRVGQQLDEEFLFVRVL